MLKRPPAPEQIAWLVDIVGEDAALAVVEAHAGTRVCVPHRPDNGVCAIVAEFDRAAAEALSQAYAGIYIRIPLVKAWRVEILRQRGLSHSKIARSLGIDVSSVERILQKARRAETTRGAHASMTPVNQLSLNLD